MAMFNQAFRTHIKNELEYRRQFDGVQAVLHPHERVTSLVEGS